AHGVAVLVAHLDLRRRLRHAAAGRVAAGVTDVEAGGRPAASGQQEREACHERLHQCVHAGALGSFKHALYELQSLARQPSTYARIAVWFEQPAECALAQIDPHIGSLIMQALSLSQILKHSACAASPPQPAAIASRPSPPINPSSRVIGLPARPQSSRRPRAPSAAPSTSAPAAGEARSDPRSARRSSTATAGP